MDETVYQSEGDRKNSLQASRTTTESPPNLPGYRLQELIGEGAFGQVWTAVQEKTGQKTAVKLLKPGVKPDSLARELERLRSVCEHPGIVTLLDADLSATPPYIVTPFFAQGSLSQFTQERPSMAQVVSWFKQVARALAFTHRQGLLHCDLKPANMLLDGEKRVRLLDFGQASLLSTDEPSFGTLGYMPPEQATLENALPSIAWDIYAMGASIYFLLTGRPPRWSAELATELSAATSIGDKLDVYREILARAPLHKPCDDPALAAIVESCLSIDPNSRPNSADQVLEDLERREANLPLLCRRPWSLRYRAQKALQRPLVRLSVAAVLLGFLSAAWFAVSISAKNRELTRSLVEAQLQAGVSAREQGDSHQALLHWSKGLQIDPGDKSLRSLLTPPAYSLEKAFPGVHYFAVNPKGKEVALSSGAEVQVWTSNLGNSLSEPMDNGYQVNYVLFDPFREGRVLAHTVALALPPKGIMQGRITLWDWKTSKSMGTFRDSGVTGPFSSIAFTPAGLGTVSIQAALWNYDTFSRITWESLGDQRIEDGAWSRDGELLAYSVNSEDLLVVKPAVGEVVARLKRPNLGEPFFTENYLFWSDGSLWARSDWKSLKTLKPLFDSTDWWDLITSPDQRYVAYTEKFSQILSMNEFRCRVTLYDVTKNPPELVATLRRLHAQEVLSFDVSPDGKWLATGSRDGTARIWSVEDGEAVSSFLRHGAPVEKVQWLDQETLLTAAEGARVWKRTHHPIPLVELDDVADMSSIVDSLVAVVRDESVEVWNIEDGNLVAQVDRKRNHEWVDPSIEFDPSGKAVVGDYSELIFWDWRNERSLERVDIPEYEFMDGTLPLRPAYLYFGTDGSAVLQSLSWDFQFWDWQKREPLGEVRNGADELIVPSFSGLDQENNLVTVSGDRNLVVYSSQTSNPVVELLQPERITSFTVSRSANWAAVGFSDGSAAAWDLNSHKLHRVHPKQASPVSFTCIAADYLAVGHEDGTAALYEISNGRRLATAHAGAHVSCLAIEPTQKVWATGGADGRVRLWSFDSHPRATAFPQGSAQIMELTFSSDGTRLLSRSLDQDRGALKIWNLDQDSGLSDEELTRRVSVWTGVQLNEQGELAIIPLEQWKGLKERESRPSSATPKP